MNIILVTEAIHLGTWGKFNILVSPMQLRFVLYLFMGTMQKQKCSRRKKIISKV